MSAGKKYVIGLKATKDSTNDPTILTHGCEALMKAYDISVANQDLSSLVVFAAASEKISKTCKKLVDVLTNKGMTIVAAAGNDNSQKPRYPAALNKVIAVAASNQQDQKAPFSNYGSWIDIVAPGVEMMTTAQNSLYEVSQGTSLSAAMVA